jgi:hypothetical protein
MSKLPQLFSSAVLVLLIPMVSAAEPARLHSATH